MIRPSIQIRMPQDRRSRGGGPASPRTPSGVTERPRAGSRYPTVEETEASGRWWAEFGMVPGGRKLWCRLVVLFTFVSLFGVVFVFIGAVFVEQAYRIYKTENLSLPLTWCVIGMFSGVLMVMGSVILGRYLISDKWRKNQQPTYPSTARRPPATVRYVSNNNNPDDPDGEVQIDLPPPYESADLPPIFVVSGRNIVLTHTPVSPAEPMVPPSYNDTIGAPPKYADIDNVPALSLLPPVSLPETRSARGGTAGQQTPTEGTLHPAESSRNRIEVITVVSTREDPPPYSTGPSTAETPACEAPSSGQGER